jgi:pyridoxal phosphate enzyme (YggS family)
VGKFSSIQTIDSLKLMDRVNSVALLNDLIQPVLLQVNAGNDPAKFGVSIENTESLLEHALTLNGICIDGFMTIAPYDPQNKSVARSCFSNLRNLRDRMSERFDCRFSKLSMGMSGDMDEAIAEGSTMIRVGSALFGNRAPVV